MPATYQLIATASGTGGNSGAFSFTNIPQTYNDLRIVGFARSTNGANQWIGMELSINGLGVNTTQINRRTYMTGGSPTSDTASSYLIGNGTSTTAGHFGIGVIYIKGYSDTNKYKPMGVYTSNTTNSTTYLTLCQSGQFQSNSAITQLDFDATSFGYTTTSKVYLYGIKNS
jgi:hypothetical protein